MLISWLIGPAWSAPLPALCHRADDKLRCDGTADAVIDAFATSWAGVVIERGADHAVAVRWSDLGPDPLELVGVHLVVTGAAGVVTLERPERVPDGPAGDRCGAGHRGVELPASGGTAAFCVPIGGPARFDGPMELKTPTWRAVGSYRDGRRIGPWRLTDAAGTPLAEGEYENDLPTGVWTVRGATVHAGDGVATVPLAPREVAVGVGAEPVVEVAAADLAQGLVAVRVRSPSGCDPLAYAVFHPGDPQAVESWSFEDPACLPAPERASRLAKVREGLASRGLDPLLPAPALIPQPAVLLEGHQIDVSAPAQTPADPGALEPAELLARLPFLDARLVEPTFESVPVEHRRASSDVRIPAVVAERGKWAIVYEVLVQEGDRWRVALEVGPVHDVAEGL